MTCASGSTRPTTCGSPARSRVTARPRGGRGSTSGCRRRSATSSATTRSAAPISWSAPTSDPKHRQRLTACFLAECLLKLDRCRAGLERTPVQRDDRHHLAYRRRRECLVGAEEPFERVDAFLDDASATPRKLEESGTGFAGEDA